MRALLRRTVPPGWPMVPRRTRTSPAGCPGLYRPPSPVAPSAEPASAHRVGVRRLVRAGPVLLAVREDVKGLPERHCLAAFTDETGLAVHHFLATRSDGLSKNRVVLDHGASPRGENGSKLRARP